MSTPPEPLAPGDPIVALASLSTNAAAFSGAGSTLAVFYKADSAWPLLVGGGTAGFVIGAIIGMLAGKALFPASADNVVVVRAGVGALSKCLKATLAPCLLASTLLALSVALVVGVPAAGSLLVVSTIVAISTGVTFAASAALT